jgi:hypothetical protein
MNMKSRMVTKSFTLWAGLGIAILVAVGTVGCATSRHEASTKEDSGAAVEPSKTGDTPQKRALAAAQACRANLHLIEGAKRQWALEHRKADTEIPADADLFGADAYIREKPKCPAGGAYTIRAVEDAPLCSIAGHTY